MQLCFIICCSEITIKPVEISRVFGTSDSDYLQSNEFKWVLLYSFHFFWWRCALLTCWRFTVHQMWCWSGGTGILRKKTLCVTMLCAIIMVHKGTSSSYRSVDCIRLWSCSFSSLFSEYLCVFDCNFFDYPCIFFFIFEWTEPGGIGSRSDWLTIILQCCDTVGWVIRPIKSSLKWRIMCQVGC